MQTVIDIGRISSVDHGQWYIGREQVARIKVVREQSLEADHRVGTQRHVELRIVAFDFCVDC